MKNKYMVLTLVLIGGILFVTWYFFNSQIYNSFFRKKQTIASVLGQHETRVYKQFQSILTAQNIDWEDFELAILAFKKEQTVEVYIRKNSHSPWLLLKEFPFTNSSGIIGPKLLNGDRQIPEGIYQMEYLNPNSKYHLSIKVSYPNAFDLKKASQDDRIDLGGDIMIHGKDVTIGCIPIGDTAIETLFTFAAKAKNTHFPIIIAPHDFRVDRNYPSVESITWEEELYAEIEKKLILFVKN